MYIYRKSEKYIYLFPYLLLFSTGVNAAAAGTLTFMVGAEKAADYEKAKTILDAMGQNITHCGEVGTGQAVKICNNMLLAISMIGVSETMNLGMK